MNSGHVWIPWAAALVLCFGGSPAFPQEAKPPLEEEVLKRLAADLPNLIKAADADGSGTLNQTEFRAFAPAVRKAAEAIQNNLDPTIAQKKAAKDLKKYDANGDGKLDEAESKAMADDKRLKEIKDFDWDRDEKINEREKTAIQWAAEGKLDYRFAQTDTDGNKEATAQELAAALPSIAGIKIKRSP